nr:hypothetical protein [Tanacetum cinerariifolium]
MLCRWGRGGVDDGGIRVEPHGGNGAAVVDGGDVVTVVMVDMVTPTVRMIMVVALEVCVGCGGDGSGGGGAWGRVVCGGNIRQSEENKHENESKECSFGVEEGKFLGYKEVEAVFQSTFGEGHHRQPIKHILGKTEASGKLAKYTVELGAYNITFEPRNDVKGQVLADFITKTPNGESPEEYFWIPKVTPEMDDTKEWMLFTDGASSSKGSRVGLVLIGPSSMEYNYALRLTFDSTNNEEEYEALLARLRIARGMCIQKLEANVNSKLVASQINMNYVASSDSMMKYLEKAKEYIACFKSFSIKNISRNQNQKADVLGKEINIIVKEEGDNWMTPIIRCLKEGVCPEDKNEARNLRIKINQYAMENGVLFKKSYLVPMIRFGLPRIIVTDNGTQFVTGLFKSWCARLNIQQMNTVVDQPQANGPVKRANKSLMEGIKTRLGREKAGWVDELPNVLWAHRTSIKTSNGETPFILTYEKEAVI